MLGVDPAMQGNFTSCSDDVQKAFEDNLDRLKHTSLYVGSLLERDIRVLIYVGTYDWICNHVGNERWTLALDWSGQSEFVSQGLRDWNVDGKRAGRTRSAKGFTFATIDAAGHMVCSVSFQEKLRLIF